MPTERGGQQTCALRRKVEPRGIRATHVLARCSRIDDDNRADPVCLPGPCVKDHRAVSQWAAEYRGRSVVVVCQKGQKLSEGAAAWLQHEGISAETLEGGFEGWKKADQTLERTDGETCTFDTMIEEFGLRT